MRFVNETPESLRDENFDVIICALGYEARATKVASQFFRGSKEKHALGFTKNLNLNYAKNLDFFQKSGFQVAENVADESFEAMVRSLFDVPFRAKVEGGIKVGVDISCFDRFRLAAIVSYIYDSVECGRISDAVFFYNIGNFSKPSPEFSYNTRLQPVHPDFVGTRPDPLSSTVAVIGLGHEREKALGAAEYLEASEVYAFHPKSQIQEYYASVAQSNALLLGQLGVKNKIDYDVCEGAALVADLSSLVRGMINKSSILMIPLGPKIFALACLLVAKIHPKASVWRMSQVADIATANRYPSDHFSILRLKG
jgi:hypothetical protein